MMLMNDKELIRRLHNNEKRILKVLEGKKSLTMKELEKETNLNKDSLEKASLWAKVKGVLKIDEEITEFLELTKEGLEYAKDKLPERKLLNEIKRGEVKIPELQKKVDRFDIGLVWLNKNNWVNIEKGELKLTNKGSKALEKTLPEEKVLSKLTKGKQTTKGFDPIIIEKLERRGLLEKSVKKKREVSLTKKGKEIAPKLEIKQEIVQLTPKILKEKAWKEEGIRPYDVTLPTTKIHPAKKHYMTQIIEYIRKIWTEMGFKEMTGPILDISFWNFDALYQPQDHPARDLADTFYMKTPEKGNLPKEKFVERVKKTHENGWETGSMGWQYDWDPEFARKCILRTHTTSLSARTLAKLKEEDLPAKFFSVGRCFRNETLDWKHLAEFYQTDGIVVGEEVTFRNLLGYLKRFFSKLGFPKARFRPAYFPYTEMSTEIEVWHPKHKEWVELGGAGMFRPEVVKPLLGKDIPVLAWGPGFGRMVMMNYKIDDIRKLYLSDLKQVREAKMWLGL
ncbi:MAG: phenylalanine--tRNA ligase subunit alpha [Candidatus Aenigmarchaeota archaeon]|nr:phenylalanine--tRNA ligase subunit alpha [Candidatus Aenigmarchaeota archaeon]